MQLYCNVQEVNDKYPCLSSDGATDAIHHMTHVQLSDYQTFLLSCLVFEKLKKSNIGQWSDSCFWMKKWKKMCEKIKVKLNAVYKGCVPSLITTSCPNLPWTILLFFHFAKAKALDKFYLICLQWWLEQWRHAASLVPSIFKLRNLSYSPRTSFVMYMYIAFCCVRDVLHTVCLYAFIIYTY